MVGWLVSQPVSQEVNSLYQSDSLFSEDSECFKISSEWGKSPTWGYLLKASSLAYFLFGYSPKAILLNKVGSEKVLKFEKSMALRYGLIQAAEMKLLGPLIGCTLYDYRRNEDTRLTLNICCVAEFVEAYHNNSHKHILRLSILLNIMLLHRWEDFS